MQAYEATLEHNCGAEVSKVNRELASQLQQVVKEWEMVMLSLIRRKGVEDGHAKPDQMSRRAIGAQKNNFGSTIISTRQNTDDGRGGF